MKKMLCVWMMFMVGSVCAQTALQDVPDATVVGPSNDPFLFSVIRGNAAYGTNALAVANSAKTTAVNASNRIVFSEGTINALVSTQRVVVAQMGALVSTQAVQSVTISNAFSLGMAAWVKANEALARENVTTNDANSISTVIVSNHNLSASAHEDIRASITNKQDIVDWTNLGNITASKVRATFGIAIGMVGVTESIGEYSLASGEFSTASELGTIAFGYGCAASADYAMAFGRTAQAVDSASFVWSGRTIDAYYSHGVGTFNINPVGGPSGFFIGETNLQTFLDEKLSTDHENEASAHGGRITTLEARPTGLTTNTPFPFVMLIDPYSTNGVVRMAVSNGIFQIWGLK